MDIVFPSMIDPGMGAAGEARHVDLRPVRAVHKLNGGWTDAKREAFGDAVVNTVESFAPGSSRKILHRQVITTADIEKITGLSEGHIFAGELALASAVLSASRAGWAKFATPVRGYYQAGSGTHPGGGSWARPAAWPRCAFSRTAREVRRDRHWRRSNGLVTAHYLARAGKRVLVVEQHETPDPSADIGWVPAAVMRDLRLAASGLRIEEPDPWITAPLPAGGTLELSRDIARSTEAIRRISPADAAQWPEFCRRMRSLAGVLERLYLAPPPDIETNDVRELARIAGLGLYVRRLGKQPVIDLARILRCRSPSCSTTGSRAMSSRDCSARSASGT